MLALFDLDNTLIDRLDAFKRWAAEFAADRGLGAQDVAWMIELDADGSIPMSTFFTHVRERFGLAESADSLWQGYRDRLPHLVTCRPAVLESLDRLRMSGWRVGIVTNGMADNQSGKIHHSGLVDRVDGWAISDAEGFRKPDRELFEIAARRCDTTLADGDWMIGDDVEKDVAGGRGAGLHTIWIDRGLSPGLSPGADHKVTDVLEAIALLDVDY
ncbi:HAD family hydrolase [Nonomuraea sp. NPDC052129]|uniref:HAD family hydrolase n=1 Tax=Nonomuraea sp. NPDC052129 TaxID=3154651 RepID=UPI00343B6374